MASPNTTGYPGIRLFLASFLILYLELALIRFASAEALYLGYFANFILISVFLGMGLGLLLVERSWRLMRYVPQLVLLLVTFLLLTHIDVTYLRDNIGQLFFGSTRGLLRLPLWLSLAIVFTLTTAVFAGIAQELGLVFGRFRPLTAYSIDISGALLGILLFTYHAWLGLTPIAWFALAFLLLAVLSAHYSLLNVLVMGAGVCVALFVTAPPHFVAWSPYQRVDVWPVEFAPGVGGFGLAANGIGHQSMAPVGYKEPIYAYPYTDLVAARGGQGYRDALIIGAGSGSDVSYALHYGVERVDAVEIDPKIQQAGVQFHPAQPYASEQVSVHIDDGRAFMQRTERRYDLVIYALPDSIATLSGFANIRLESFLFTVESFRQARRLLREDGVLVLYNYYREPWLVDKLAGMLHEVFGRYPLQAEYRHPTSGVLTALAVGPRLGNTAWNGTPPPPPATDSWPFLYMRAPHLPPMYLGIMLLFVGCAVFGVMATGHARLGGLRENGVFFLMGAAFLLLETKSIIQFLLLFGSTWLVNSLVFFAILVSVLVANLIVQRFDFRRPALLFGLLFASLALMYLLPASALLAIEHPATRYVVASAVHFSPIFFANLAFGCMFRDTPKATAAFGWNIIGTMAGGALEYSSLAIGYRSLTLVVIALYLASFAWAYWALGARRPAG